MSCKRLCFLVLVLHSWSAVMARPSDTTASSQPDRDTIIARCRASRPNILATPQQIAGEWCKMESTVVGELENATDYMACTRYTYSSDGDRLQVILKIVFNEKVHESNQTFSPFDNESWITSGSRPNVIFFGFSDDGQYLLTRVCRVYGADIQQADEVNEIALARCLKPGEEGLPPTGSRTDVVRCNLPAA